MVIDASLLNTQYYKLRSKDSGVIQGKEKIPSKHLGVVPIAKGAFKSPSATID